MKSILVWDWPVRIMHWLLVVLFAGLIYTGKSDQDYMEYHFYMGYGLSAVVIARFLYGLFGSHYALFSQFLKGPKHVLSYAQSLLFSRPKKYLGHNPLGGLMVIVLLLALTVQWVTGLFNSDDIFWFGPFSGLLSERWISAFSYLHHLLPNLLLALVAVHILAVLYHEVCLKERLIDAMILGRKKHSKKAKNAATPRWGVLFSLIMGLAWLIALWLMPI